MYVRMVVFLSLCVFDTPVCPRACCCAHISAPYINVFAHARVYTQIPGTDEISGDDQCHKHCELNKATVCPGVLRSNIAQPGTLNSLVYMYIRRLSFRVALFSEYV